MVTYNQDYLVVHQRNNKMLHLDCSCSEIYVCITSSI